MILVGNVVNNLNQDVTVTLKHLRILPILLAGPCREVCRASDSRARDPGFDTFVSPPADSRRAVVSYW